LVAGTPCSCDVNENPIYINAVLRRGELVGAKVLFKQALKAGPNLPHNPDPRDRLQQWSAEGKKNYTK
jgi:hypothetical protein